jgi:hypothetical protein
MGLRAKMQIPEKTQDVPVTRNVRHYAHRETDSVRIPKTLLAMMQAQNIIAMNRGFGKPLNVWIMLKTIVSRAIRITHLIAQNARKEQSGVKMEI